MYLEDKAQGEPTLQGFKDFVNSKNPDERYDWSHCGKCACGQYAKSLGIDNWIDPFLPEHDLWSNLNIKAAGTAGSYAWTFGDLAKRLETA